jgi:Alpha-L-arabinofuranosidase B (ABFB) domain
VRFQSLEFPKKFLRHKDFRLLLEEPAPEEGQLFLDDSTFIALAPNGVGSIITQAFSFGASNTNNFPNYFIRHRDFHVFLNEVTPDDERAKQDSSFQQVATT